MALVTFMDTTRKDAPSCALRFLLFLSSAIGPDCARSYNIYGGNNDLTAAFSDVQRFIRYVSENSCLSYSFANLPPIIDGAWR
jgi:Zn/Cd-binding protein ZinT